MTAPSTGHIGTYMGSALSPGGLVFAPFELNNPTDVHCIAVG